NQFSIPFLFNISEPANTAIIIKPGATSPILNDMKNSDYATRTIGYLMNAKNKICVFNIGKELSPYWRSLAELRLIDCSFADVKSIPAKVNAKEADFIYEDSTCVSLNESHLSIIKQPTSSVQKTIAAPDHLLRLFAYNDVLRKIGKRYFEKEKYENELFREAEEGYVVSPISSMIVLESNADYERTGIKENVNTVGNAGIISGGAVPEPHEWLLIALTFSMALRFIYLKRKKERASYAGK
ncbi:MAG: hypothetical protein IAF38_02540, partial [Bacteroidia bacterium]|nr:hypothetical protein [Bacteroidia bacterium]